MRRNAATLDAAAVRHRQFASQVLGYANPSKEQIAALMCATRGAGGDAALGHPAAEIPAEEFIAMLNPERDAGSQLTISPHELHTCSRDTRASG